MINESYGIVVIGRNEGDRLKKCLHSIVGETSAIVYVDSGSTDKSIEVANSLGIHVVNLDMSKPFTAARARNVGFDYLLENYPDINYVQFIDGDCEVIAGWFEHAMSAFSDNESKDQLAVVFGLCKERFPDASLYNYEADRGWRIKPGYTETCGGIAFVSVQAFKSVKGFNQNLIAGEEPEFCLRLRQAGWRILCVPNDMVWHDINIHNFGQWFKRAVRTGYAFAEVAWIHRKLPEKYWFRHNRKIFLWGFLVPLILIILTFYNLGFFSLFLVYPIRMIRIAIREDWIYAYFCILVSFPQAIGQFRFIKNSILGKKNGLIEYK